MNQKKFTRFLTAVLALICVIGTVAGIVAAGSNYLGDVNGDGRVTAYDAQLLSEYKANKVSGSKLTGVSNRVLEQLTFDNVLSLLFGTTTEEDLDIEMDIHIKTAADLLAMAEKPMGYFILDNDIDLGGMDWTPVVYFNGTFDGQGHTIRNFKITQAVPSKGTSTTEFNMGFFGDDTASSEIKDLHLADFTIVASNTKAKFIGGLLGTNRGPVSGCTVDGQIVDSRAKYNGDAIYRGVLVGRNATGANASLELSNMQTWESDKEKINVASVMAFDLPEGTKPNSGGNWFVGYGKYTITVTDNWRDSSNSTELMEQELQDRRQTVVDAMYEMGTVLWTPSQTMKLTYFKTQKAPDDFDTSTYKAGNIYRGIPYNHGSSGMERFEAYTNNPVLGIRTVKSSVPTTAYYFTYNASLQAAAIKLGLKTLSDITDAELKAKTEAFLNQYGEKLDDAIGMSDQALTAVSGKISSADHAGFSRYFGNDCSSSASWAWRAVSAVTGTDSAFIRDTGTISPAPANIKDYGIVPLAGFTIEDFGSGTTNAMKKVEAAYAANPNGLLEAYAAASKGDVIVGYNTAGGHTRLLAYDPVIIRNAAGTIDVMQSYIVTHEQGRGSSGTGWTSSWSINWYYTLDQVTNYQNYTTSIGSKCCYVPVTMTALNEVDTDAVNATITINGKTVKSNFHIVSTTVNGETVFTGVQQRGHRERFTSVNLSVAHPGVAAGATATVLLANGETYTVTVG